MIAIQKSHIKTIPLPDTMIVLPVFDSLKQHKPEKRLGRFYVCLYCLPLTAMQNPFHWRKPFSTEFNVPGRA